MGTEMMVMTFVSVTPAKAGASLLFWPRKTSGIPAFAGMTGGAL